MRSHSVATQLSPRPGPARRKRGPEENTAIRRGGTGRINVRVVSDCVPPAEPVAHRFGLDRLCHPAARGHKFGSGLAGSCEWCSGSGVVKQDAVAKSRGDIQSPGSFSPPSTPEIKARRERMGVSPSAIVLAATDAPTHSVPMSSLAATVYGASIGVSTNARLTFPDKNAVPQILPNPFKSRSVIFKGWMDVAEAQVARSLAFAAITRVSKSTYP